jgi:WD40 repeat protein
MSHKHAIETAPLQVYISALVFSPKQSLVGKHFIKDAPRWIQVKPCIQDEWSACLQTLEDYSHFVKSVAFSPDSTMLASGSYDGTIKIWELSIGATLHTLEGHSDWVSLVVFSHDAKQLVSGSFDMMIKVWDATEGTCLQTLSDHSEVFLGKT